MSLIVKCIDNNNIQNVELNKLYSVSLLTKTTVKLLDTVTRLNYSTKRFTIIEYNGEFFNIPLEKFINIYFQNFPNKKPIYISKRIIYNLKIGGYLISFRNKIKNVEVDDVFKIKSFFKNGFGTKSYYLININTNKIITVENSQIFTNFYNIEKCEVSYKMRKQKIEKIKNKLCK